MEHRVGFKLKVEWQTSCSFSFSKDRFLELFLKIAGYQGLKGEYGLSVHLIDKRKMRSLNYKFCNIDKATDVLSFPVRFSKLSKKSPNLLGDIFICIPQVEKQAKELKISKSLEFEILTVHGFLHLLGVEHKTDFELWDKTLQGLYQNRILSYNHIRYAQKQAS